VHISRVHPIEIPSASNLDVEREHNHSFSTLPEHLPRGPPEAAKNHTNTCGKQRFSTSSPWRAESRHDFAEKDQ
jgi:hypothetical protein